MALVSNAQVAELLLKHGADVNEKDAHGRTPIRRATSTRNRDLARVLRSHGADPASDLGDIDDYEDARIAVKNALLCGYPGYFVASGMVQGICGFDPRSGVPVRAIGDDITTIDLERMAGHNAGLIEFIEAHGIPWNSRLRWLKELLDPAAFFLSRLKQEQPFEFVVGGEHATTPDGSTIIKLKGEMLVVTSTKFWQRPNPADFTQMAESKCKVGDLSPTPSPTGYRALPPFIDISDYHYFKSIEPKRPARWPVLGEVWTDRPITLEIELAFFEGAENVEMFWGPEGSGLAFFRFQNVENLVVSSMPEMLGVLDLYFLEWVDSTACDMFQRVKHSSRQLNPTPAPPGFQP